MMNTKWKLLFLCLLWTTQITGTDLTLSGIQPFTWNAAAGYNPFDTIPYIETCQFSVENNSSNDLDYTVLFSEGLHSSGNFNRYASDGNGHTLAYQLYSINELNPSFILKNFGAYPNWTQYNVIGNFSTNTQVPAYSSVTKYFYMAVPVNQIVRPGLYQDTVTVKLHKKIYSDIASDTDNLEETVSMTLSISVIQVLNLETDTSTIDFEDPITGQTENLNLSIQSNLPYKIKVSSYNGGYLKRNPAISGSIIPYTIQIPNSSYMSVSQTPTLLINANSATPLSGTAYSSAIKLGNTANIFSGNYTDQLILQIEEN